MDNLTIIEQLNNIYYKEEWWQSHKETLAGITNYHQTMMDKGNLICHIENGEVLGYVEMWFINFEQFGRIVCREEFIAPLENTTDGNICYLANTWIKPEYRNNCVYKKLKVKFFQISHKCDYFVGEALRKRTQPIKVFKKSELIGRLFKEGVTENG